MQPLDIIHDDLLLELVLDLLKQGRTASFVACGSSMNPLILDGDRVSVTPATADSLLPGAIALYLPDLPTGGSGMVIHRVQGRDSSGNMILQGDACPLPDPPVPADKVVGRVIAVAREGREVDESSWSGRQLLNCNQGLRRWTAGILLSDSHVPEDSGVRFLPVSHGRLLRERDLVQLCLGQEVVLEELEDEDEPLRLSAAEYGLLPLIMHQLRLIGIDWEAHLPAGAGTAELEALSSASRTKQALHWLAGVLEVSELKLLLTRGAAMAWEVYPDPSCRPVSEVHLVSQPEMIEQTLAALLKAGAALANTDQTISQSLAFGDTIRLRPPDPTWPCLALSGGVGAGPIYDQRLTVGRLLAEAEESRFGPSIVVLNREAQLVHSILYIARHLPNLRLLWAVDMALLSLVEEFDWDRITDWLTAERLSLPGAVICRWFEDHVPGILPAGVTTALTEHAASNSSRLERHLLYQNEGSLQALLGMWTGAGPCRSIGNLMRTLFPCRRDLERHFPSSRNASRLSLQGQHLSQWLKGLCS